jgi:peptidoglycan/LPS O-acetylase OafA/YrhL
MVDSLLWIHVLLDGTLAQLFLLTPRLSLRILGLPASPTQFWPRIAGALLAGLALANLAGLLGWTKTGIGLAGHIAVSLSVAFVLLTMLMTGTEIPTKRGRAILWTMAIGLILLSLVEVAYAQ